MAGLSEGESAEDIFELYREEIRRADAIITVTPFDTPPRNAKRGGASERPRPLSFVVLHVIAETACHAGHLDVVRELLDGRQWIAL